MALIKAPLVSLILPRDVGTVDERRDGTHDLWAICLVVIGRQTDLRGNPAYTWNIAPRTYSRINH
jgi:hypothetical protein